MKMRGIRRELKSLKRSFLRSPVRFIQGLALIIFSLTILNNWICPIPGLNFILNTPIFTLENGQAITVAWGAGFIYAATLMGFIHTRG